MEYEIEFNPLARDEADRAAAWIAQYSEVRAAKWHRGLLDAIATLRRNPERFALAPESESFRAEIRQMLYGKRRGIYRILYAIRGKAVVILRIRHGARRFLEP